MISSEDARVMVAKCAGCSRKELTSVVFQPAGGSRLNNLDEGTIAEALAEGEMKRRGWKTWCFSGLICPDCYQKLQDFVRNIFRTDNAKASEDVVHAGGKVLSESSH